MQDEPGIMNKQIFFRKRLYFILILFLLNHSAIAQNNTTHLTFTTLNGLIFPKIAEEIMREAYKRVGNIDIQIIEQPAARALVTANSGEVDGELARIESLNKKLFNLIRLPTLIMDFDIVCFTKNKAIKIDSVNSLMPYRVGVQRGYVQVENVSKNLPKREIVTSNDSLFKMLESDRLDVVITDRVNGDITIEKFGFKSIKPTGPVLETLPLYHYLHKKNVKLIPKLKKVLNEMQQSGAIRKITKDTIVNIKKMYNKKFKS